MSGGSKQQTTTTNTAPWSGAQPALKTALSGAQRLYKSGTGAQVYSGSTVVPWDAQTKAGMGIVTDAANANSGGQGLSGRYQGIIDAGGYNDEQQSALGNTRALANASYSVSPELQRVLDAQSSKVSEAVNANASAAGRYGSGSNQNLLAKNVGDLANSTIYNDYTNFLGRKDAANTSLFNMGQTGIGNLGTAYEGLQAPAQSLFQVGAMNEDLATRQLNDKLRVFNEKQNKPWENLARLNAIASGAGQLGGTSTSAQPGQNPFLTALGYGLSGAGLLGGF